MSIDLSLCGIRFREANSLKYLQIRIIIGKPLDALLKLEPI
jgi:hypothetical protein